MVSHVVPLGLHHFRTPSTLGKEMAMVEKEGRKEGGWPLLHTHLILPTDEVIAQHPPPLIY